MTPEDKKLWEAIARTIKPLKKKKKEKRPDQSPSLSTRSLHENSLHTQSKKEDEEKKSFAPKEQTPSLPHIQFSQNRLLTKKLRRGSYTIQATLDLHGQTQDEAYASLQRFLGWALKKKLKLILVITGKGMQKKSFSSLESGDQASVGILRKKVPEWLGNTKDFPGVLSVSVARPQEGGVGALYIELRSLPQ